ncbi:Protein EXORDIUM-like 2 [Abeliophyllum distichum]|uniref:Protein EXORDIUM-like 2 n=1 Tax=Abeliophyllum distichum TaxID=126358 RepID=A0ABD1RRD7_9LAMI
MERRHRPHIRLACFTTKKKFEFKYLITPNPTHPPTHLPPSISAIIFFLLFREGPLLKGTIAVNLIWYGKFTPIQRSIIIDYLQSINSVKAPQPSVSTWWKTTEKYKSGARGSSTLVVGKQILDENYSLGKSLKNSHIIFLAAKGGHLSGSVNVVLTAKDVAVDGFCMSRCGGHGSTRGATRFAYAWVGNSETQCPGYCAWPFHQPIYGPQTPPLGGAKRRRRS